MATYSKETTKEDQEIAMNCVQDFQAVYQSVKLSRKNEVKIKVEETDEFITIPKSALTILSAVIENMARGESISIVSSSSELSTQQVATMLNVSRPHIVKLLETKKIPFKKVGSHRRILLKDVMEFKEQLAKEREAQLDFLSNQAQNLKLGYE